MCKTKIGKYALSYFADLISFVIFGVFVGLYFFFLRLAASPLQALIQQGALQGINQGSVKLYLFVMLLGYYLLFLIALALRTLATCIVYNTLLKKKYSIKKFLKVALIKLNYLITFLIIVLFPAYIIRVYSFLAAAIYAAITTSIIVYFMVNINVRFFKNPIIESIRDGYLIAKNKFDKINITYIVSAISVIAFSVGVYFINKAFKTVAWFNNPSLWHLAIKYLILAIIILIPIAIARVELINIISKQRVK